MNFGRLLLRLALGGFLFGHGTQKLFGWFGGSGPAETGAGFEQLGLRPGKRNALAAGAAEAGGGLLLGLGLATPLGAAAVTGAMLTAIDRVHLKNGPWITKGGYEYNAVLIAAALALVEAGPGALSVDAARRSRRRGSAWALASLAAGTAGAAGVSLLARRYDAANPLPAPAAEATGEAGHDDSAAPAARAA